MADNVIQFTARPEPDNGSGLIYCPCGDAWWDLPDGAVNFRPDMTISGWTGTPTCRTCSRPMR